MRTEPTGGYRGPPTTHEEDARERERQRLATIRALRQPRPHPPEPKDLHSYPEQVEKQGY